MCIRDSYHTVLDGRVTDFIEIPSKWELDDYVAQAYSCLLYTAPQKPQAHQSGHRRQQTPPHCLFAPERSDSLPHSRRPPLPPDGGHLAFFLKSF